MSDKPSKPEAAAAGRAAHVALSPAVASTLERTRVIQGVLPGSAMPSVTKLAALQTLPPGATLQIFDAVNRMADLYPMPAMTRLLDGITGNLAFGSLLQASGIVSQVNSMIATLAPQRAALDAIAAAQFAQDGVFRGQILQILSAEASIGRLVSNTGYSSALAGLLATVSRYGQVQTQLAALTIRPDSARLLRGITTQSGRRYDSYLDSLPVRPIARRVTVARQAGDTQTGLLIAESLTAPHLRGDDREELAEHLTATVLQPWQTGPTDARTDLFGVLASLDSGLPDWLKAAWDDIGRDGPKAASKIANCIVECIDRALRIAAPPADVVVWLNTIPSKQGYLHDGKPTRRAKIMFVMRNRAARDAKLAAAQVDALVILVQEVTNNLQSVKHGEAPSIATMRSCVLAAEGALAQLFLHD